MTHLEKPWHGMLHRGLLMSMLHAVIFAFPAAGQSLFTEPPRALDKPALVGDTIRFTFRADTSGDLPLTYAWNFSDGDGNTAYTSSPDIKHVFEKPGRYIVFARIKEGTYVESDHFLLVVAPRPTTGKPTHASTIVFDSARQRVWNVNPDNNTISATDAESHTKLQELSVGRHPRTLALAPDGNLWVTLQDEAAVAVVDPEAGKVSQRISMPYASRPYGVAFSPDGVWAYVTLEATGKLARIEVATGKLDRQTGVFPTPRGIAVTHDGSRILVTRFLAPKDHGEIAVVDAADFARTKTIELIYDPTPDAENAGGGVPNYISSISITPDGKRAWYGAKKDNTRRGQALTGDKIDFESTVRTFVGQVDMESLTESPTDRFDLDNSSMAGAVAYSPLGDLVYIAVLGNNRVDVMDPYNNGTVNVMFRNSGISPDGLVADPSGKWLYVHSFLSRSVQVYDMRSIHSMVKEIDTAHAVVNVVSKELLSSDVLQGKQLFYNAEDERMSKDGYMSCAVCHIDGTTDSRVWDFTDRGEGMRKTHSLLGRSGMGHGPVHHSANFDEIQDFEHDIRGPFGGRGFMKDTDFGRGTRMTTLGDPKAGFSPELDALAAYVASLDSVNPSPHRNQSGDLTTEALEGKKLFFSEEVGCYVCHTGPAFTISALPKSGEALFSPELPGNARGFLTPQGFVVFDVGTLDSLSGKRLNDSLMGLDVPTLKGIWEFPPYLHQGQAATLMDVLTTHNPDDAHGVTSNLSRTQLEQLHAFLLQIDESSDVLSPVTRIAGAPLSSLQQTLTVATGPDGRTLRVMLPAAAFQTGANLSILDMTGRVVKRFPSLVLAGDASTLTWDGSDQNQKPSGPGTYILRLQTGDGRFNATGVLR